MSRALRILGVTMVLLGAPAALTAQERLCDPQSEDCRTPLLDLIRNEQVAIDVAFWFMEDARYANELIKKYSAGIPVRILVDTRANASKRLNADMLATLANARIPMRNKFGADVLHWKMMLFHGQNVVEFSKANYIPSSFVPIQPYVNYDDEVIFFTNDTRLTNSFRRRFDDLWTNTSVYQDYANITSPPARAYPLYPIDPSMNFVPLQDFSDRSVNRMNAEPLGIDAIVFRVTNHRQADAAIAAVARGVPVRFITEPTEYRNPARVWDAKHVDRMYMAGVQIKIRKHEGLMHQGSIVLRGLGEVIFGSSNWTTASASYEDEHNYFYNPSLGKPWFYQWFSDNFDSKWNDATNYGPFEPLPPDAPSYVAPANLAVGVGTAVTLTWDGGPWAHLYDIYFGTTPDPPLVASNEELGSPLAGQRETYVVSNLLPGTTYYWRIVSKTWAQMTQSGNVWSFTTAGTAPGGGTSPPTDSTPYGGTAAAVPGTFQAEDFDNGGQGVAYSDASAGNSGGAYRTTDVDIQATTDTGGGYNVGWTRAGEWLRYTVNIAASGTYTLESRVAMIGSGARFHLEVDGVNRSGPIAVPDTGAWQSWQTITAGGISLSAGQHVLSVVFDSVGSSGGAGNYNWFRLAQTGTSDAYGGTPASIPGILQAENFDAGVQGAAYYDTIAGNSGGAYRTTDVDIGTTADAGNGGYYVGWTRVGEWLDYTVNIAETRTYTLNLRVANAGSGATFRIECDGTDLTGAVAMPNTGGWDTWQTVPLTGISLTQGQHVVRLVMLTRNAENSGAGNYGYISFQ